LRVASRLHNDRPVRWLVAIAAASAPGCFYVDPINQRPSATIVRDPPANLPVRGGDPITVSAKWSDPDGDDVTFSWSVTKCYATGACADAPYLFWTADDKFPISVPKEGMGEPPITKIDIHLDVTDVHGAVARPGQDLILDVADQAPMLQPLVATGRQWPTGTSKFVVSLPIDVSAMKSDPDGDPVRLEWDPAYATGTDGAKSKWVPISTSDSLEVEQFTPDVAGTWSILVHADDGLGGKTDQPLSIDVEPDRPPCLGTTDPSLTTATIVLDQARRFSVFTVDDDLNVYPAPTPGSLLGAAGFHWSLATPASAGAFTALGTDENNVVIDPADYAPGDTIDVRVEVSDAIARTMPCDPSTAQCSMIADPTCLQRQTWHLEVR
jgi:hypothetical protein